MNIEYIRGEAIEVYTSTFPSRRYSYRHDRVVVDGRELKGFIQVRHRFGRWETTTCFENMAVMGANVPWLIVQNAGAE